MAQADGIDPGYLPIIMTATLLRDVGKTRVPLEILNKPGRFEPEELEQMRKHAVYSGVIMREEGGFTDEQIAFAEQHHEMLNSEGYPYGLKGDVVYEPNVENSRRPTLGILTQSNGKKRAAPLVCNLALRSEAEGREVSKVLDQEKVDVDVDEVMEQIKTRGEHSDRLRR
ncbi:MAG TPA: hypothetical protein EYQ31_00830 [Candidatus Handelsmanbacteria bacterium]|nr:hypothetical protein [Candidatus Handelsmanbacteria bacterium]